ncbi:unnamed protein product [Phaedon cochleariae]|uniref:aralkylamine N-acetyltransferase n=1 Tax=Phaedon cochleariae TaxID=80249 RepID=A0A9P0DRH1_PHACE|nr:unnamed protein product [Phaedon cochleariae]
MTNHFGKFINKILSELKPTIFIPTRNRSIFRGSKAKQQNLSPYIILKATKEDYDHVLKLMHECFYIEEPTCLSLNLNHNTILDETALKNMAEGITLVARCKYDGCIVGACINNTTNPWDPDLKEKLACNVQCTKTKQLLLFQAHVQRFPRLWNCYDVQKVFEISNVFLKRELRKTDIMEKLVRESKDLAADCGYKVVRLDATSKNLVELCKKVNMELAAEIPYCMYIGKNNKPVFDPPHPNDSVKIYVDVDPQIKKVVGNDSSISK